MMPRTGVTTGANLARLGDEVLGTRIAWLVAHPDVARIPSVRKVIDFVVAMMKKEAAFLAGNVVPSEQRTL